MQHNPVESLRQSRIDSPPWLYPVAIDYSFRPRSVILLTSHARHPVGRAETGNSDKAAVKLVTSRGSKSPMVRGQRHASRRVRRFAEAVFKFLYASRRMHSPESAKAMPATTTVDRDQPARAIGRGHLRSIGWSERRAGGVDKVGPSLPIRHRSRHCSVARPAKISNLGHRPRTSSPWSMPPPTSFTGTRTLPGEVQLQSAFGSSLNSDIAFEPELNTS